MHILKPERLTSSLIITILLFLFSRNLIAIEVGGNNKVINIPDPVAIVNNKYISKAEFEQYAQYINNRFKTDSAEASNSLIEQMVLEELLVQEAEKQKIREDQKFQKQLEILQRSLLANSVIRKLLNDSAVPSEATIRKEYENAIDSMKGKEYKARHILVDSEEKARSIITELKNGADFTNLVKLNSKDSSKETGGDLGWFTPNIMVPAIAQAVTKMDKNTFSDQPVQTNFGWHILLLEDIRDAVPPSFEDMKPQIEQMLQNQTVSAYLERLKSEAKISINSVQENIQPK